MICIKNFKHKKADNSNDMRIAADNKKGLRTVLLDDLDELNAIAEDLKVLSYLNVLVQEDFAGGYITDVFASQSKDTVQMYLLEEQIDKVRKLDGLIKKSAYKKQL